MADFRVLVCGGGVAALEGLLRLRRLVPEGLELMLLAPNEEFVHRPMAVLEAVGFGPAHRRPIRDVADAGRATWIKDSLAWIDREAQVAHSGAGEELGFDAALVAVGGRQIAEFEHALTFRDAEAGAMYEQVVGRVISGDVRSIAFVIPEGPSYLLPMYELALMTVARARAAGVEGLEVHLVTPEPAPLAAFGGTAGAVVAGLLAQSRIQQHTSSTAFVPAPGQLILQPEGLDLRPGAIVAMPRVSGPAIRGLPGGGAHGFIPIDQHCAVPGAGGRIFAAGDATAFPLKHGGLGAQQADAAAAAIAHLAGGAGEPAPFRPQIKSRLLTGGEPRFLSARVVGSQGFESEVSDTPPWPVDDKLVTGDLAAFLAGRPPLPALADG